MWNSAKSKAEEKFAAAQRKSVQAAKDKERAQQQLEDRIAKQRALRLAKEAADKEAADTQTAGQADPKKPAAETTKP